MSLLDLTISTIGGAAVGAVATILVQGLLPENTKAKIRYIGNYYSNRLFRGDFVVQTSLARSYDLDDPVPLDELSDDLWEEFDSRARGSNDHFEFTRERGGVEYSVDIQLQWEANSNFAAMSAGLAGGDDFDMPSSGGEQRQVENIRVEVEAQIPYSQLEQLLFRSYDLLRDIEQSVPEDLSGNAYALSCETGDPPIVNEFMAKLGFETVRASDENGIEFETREDRIRVRNLNGSQVDEAITKTHKMVTLFG